MTLQDLGNLGEIVGSLAVVISLLYLAAQIRQNSRLLRASALEQQMAAGAAMLQTTGGSLETARVLGRGLGGLDQLQGAERTQFFSLLGLAFIGFQTSWYLHAEGLSNEDMWRRQRSIIRWYLSQPGVRAWWDGFARETVMSAGFVKMVEAELLGAVPQQSAARRGAVAAEVAAGATSEPGATR